MENTALKTEYITARELAELKGVTVRAVRKACERGKYHYRFVDGNGGKQYEIAVYSLEPELQNKINSFPSVSPQGAESSSPLLPATFSLNGNMILNQVQNDGQISAHGNNKGNSVVISPNAIPAVKVEAPQKAKNIGLARYDLVKKWEEFRLNFGREEEIETVNQTLQLADLLYSSENRHRLLLFIKDLKISVQETVNFIGVSKVAIINKIKTGKYKFEEATGRGGKLYLIYVSSLPQEKQIEWFLTNQEKYPQIVEMIRLGHEFSVKKAPKKRVKKTEADNEFITLYNEALAFPTLFEILGNVSLQTLYRWKKLSDDAGSYTVLIPEYNYRDNANRQTHLMEIERKFLLDTLLRPQKSSIGNAIRFTKFILERQGVTNLCSDSTYRRFAEWWKSRNLDTWVFIREGQKALIDKVAPYVKRDASMLEVGDVLVADGHTLDFQVVNPFTGKPCRATLVGYMDWKSNALVGYEIMLTENTQCIASALRNAIINLGKIPKICYQDNGKAFKSKFFKGTKNLDELGFTGVFGQLGIIPVFAKPYNAKAKTIERFFREFTQTFESLLPSYVGNNLQNKPAYLMRNEKFHKEHHNEFVPTIEQAVFLIDKWMEFHYAQPCPHVKGKTIGEVYQQGRGEGVDINRLDDLLMATETRKIGRNGIKFLNNFYYSDKLYGIQDSVSIRYSLFDLNSIKVYGSDGQFICKADTVIAVHPMANYLGDKQDIYNRTYATSSKTS